MPVRGQGAQAIAQRSPHPFTPSVRVNEREPAEPERALGGGAQHSPQSWRRGAQHHASLGKAGGARQLQLPQEQGMRAAAEGALRAAEATAAPSGQQ